MSRTYLLNVLVNPLHELLAALRGSGLLETEFLHELVGLNLFFAELDMIGIQLNFAHLEEGIKIKICPADADAHIRLIKLTHQALMLPQTMPPIAQPMMM